MQISLNVAERGPPIEQPSVCLQSLLLNVKVTSADNLISKHLNINSLHLAFNLC